METANNNENTILTLDEFCRRLGISTSTARRLMDAGKLPYLRVGKSIRMTEQQVQRFIDSNSFN